MEDVYDALNFNNLEDEYYNDTPLDQSYGSEFVIHCSYIYSDINDSISSSINNNDNEPLSIRNETFIKLEEDLFKSPLGKNDGQEALPKDKSDSNTDCESKNTKEELKQSHGLNSPDFISLDLTGEPFPKCDIKEERASKIKKTTSATCVRKTAVKRPFPDSTRTLNQTKRRRCDNLDSFPQQSSSKRRYQGPFFYPHDHRNDTDPMWSKYKSNKSSPFEIVQNDWKNTLLSYPHLDLSHMEGKRLHNNVSYRRECVHVRRIYDNEISRLLQAKGNILNEMSRPCQKFYQRNKFCRRRLSKINEDLAVYENAKGEVDYLMSNYHNEHFDAAFMSQYQLDEILDEKEKISSYENIYGRSK